MIEPSECPLCHSHEIRPFAEAHERRYLECTVCRLVHLLPRQRLDLSAERAHYETHENDPDDPGYRAFLSRVCSPLSKHLPDGAEGLDYGSGPGPTLSLMLQEYGFRVEHYDPMFAPAMEALHHSYDFITCTETAEHFFRPAEEFEQLDRLLRPGGWLGVMTEMLQEGQGLEGWRYARDPTHVCFYRVHTMKWIASHFEWSAEFPQRNVVLFRKRADAATGERSTDRRVP